MRVRVTSDGTRAGTRIVDADSGEPIDGLHCLGIVWEIEDHDAEPVCTLKCRSVEVDIEAEALLRPQTA